MKWVDPHAMLLRLQSGGTACMIGSSDFLAVGGVPVYSNDANQNCSKRASVRKSVIGSLYLNH